MKSLTNKMITGAALLAIAMSSPSKEKSTDDGMSYIPNGTYKGTFEEFFVPSQINPLEGYVAINIEKPRVVDQYFVEKVIKLESNYNSKAVSPKGARGKMQIMPIALKEWNNDHPNEQYTLNDLFDSKINIKIGTYQLRKIEDHYLPAYKLSITPENILASYNWGPYNVGEKLKRDVKGERDKGIPRETRNYIAEFKNLEDPTPLTFE